MQSPLAWPPRPSDKIDAAVAGFAGLALAFAVVAMPDSLFASLITKSGLPGIFPAASPPLGQTARGAAAAAAGIGGFLLLFLLLRALGGKPTPARSRRVDTAPMPVPPRVRRADAHPDAPSRAPILAGAELGEPLLGDGEPLELDQEAEPETGDLPWRMAEEIAETPRRWHGLDTEQVGLATADRSEALPLDKEALPAMVELPRGPDEDDFDVSRLPEWEEQEVRTPAFDALPQVGRGSDGIPDLVARFERGLRRRAVAVEPAAPEMRGFPTPSADPLANAISGLERLANKRG